MLKKNRVLERLRAGKYVVFFNPTPFCSSKLIEIGGLIGLDGVWIDMEHQDYDYNTVSQMCLACRATGIEPMIRVRKSGNDCIYRAFECGGTGIMVPHVTSAQEAQWVARNSRFYPEGLRGLDGVEPTAAYGLVGLREYMEHANRENFVVVQIEDVEAMDCLDEIASTPGIDILFFGAQDFSQSVGVPCEVRHPKVLEARQKVAEAALRHGKWWGCPAQVEEAKRLYEQEGATFFAACSAIWLVEEGFKKCREEFNELLGE